MKVGTLLIYGNGIFKPVAHTPFEGVEKSTSFKRLLPKLRNGSIVKFHNREFKMVV